MVVFLVAVAAFIWIGTRNAVAVGAVVSVLHDLIITAGIYSLVGFEVTPATVIGLLTILGFSLYDTVVVFDKVQENTKGLTSLTRRTYPEAANLAVNQTLMRSINTSLIALLPVAGLLVAGVVDPGLRHAEGPGPGAAGRHARRRLLVGVRRRAAGRRPEAAGPGDQGAHRPGGCQAQERGPDRRRRRRPDLAHGTPEATGRQVPPAGTAAAAGSSPGIKPGAPPKPGARSDPAVGQANGAARPVDHGSSRRDGTTGAHPVGPVDGRAGRAGRAR